jgi:hypothetical protein
MNLGSQYYRAPFPENRYWDDDLRGWDCWNETRWNVDADGVVCHCPHTLDAFRLWLTEMHGDLDGLNRAWKRRYGQWDEVQPGKWHGHTYTEMMAFSHFLTVRSNRHGRNRRLVFVFFQQEHHAAHLRFRNGFFAYDSVHDLITGAVHRLSAGPEGSTELKMDCPDWRFAVLAEEDRL